jgi:heat shock protein HslJ
VSSGTLVRMTRVLLLLATALVAVAAAGIGSAASSPLTGQVWVLKTLLGKPPLQGTELTSEFTSSGSVSGTAGCNSYGGKYTASGKSLRISSLASTQMACAPKIMAQESAFLKALSVTRSYSVSGTTLTIKSAAGLLTYTAQSQALAGTSWNVTAYNNGKQGVESVLASPKLTATFGKDGNLSGFGGCNNYNATYKATAPRISIGAVNSTRKECAMPKGVMDQELRYLAALHTAATYRVEGSRLELRTASGALAAEFQRR